MREGEKNPFEVTTIEQLKEYKFSLWPMTSEEAAKAKESGEIDQRIKDATDKAEAIINKEGGLTFSDLEELGFFREDDPRHRTDI